MDYSSQILAFEIFQMLEFRIHCKSYVSVPPQFKISVRVYMSEVGAAFLLTCTMVFPQLKMKHIAIFPCLCIKYVVSKYLPIFVWMCVRLWETEVEGTESRTEKQE